MNALSNYSNAISNYINVISNYINAYYCFRTGIRRFNIINYNTKTIPFNSQRHTFSNTVIVAISYHENLKYCM